MWFKRLLALGSLIAIVLVVVAVTRGSSSSESSAVTTARATPTATAKPRRPRASATPVRRDEVRGAAARRLRVPILMYHVVSKAPPGVANAELWVDKDVFAAEMQALHGAGYEAVTLQEVYDGWTRGAPLPKKPIVVSFDDGYLSHYTHAKPVLHALGWPGVLFLKTDAIGPGGLTTRQIRSLMAAGWEIDSHTLTHPDLPSLGDAELRRQLVDSRKELRERFGVPANFFAYPAGRFDARVVAATRAAGYLAAATVIEGVARRADDPFELPRVRVNASDTAASLLARLESS